MLDECLQEKTLSNISIGSFNEWDPLEEVIVGHVDGAMWPDWDLVESVPVSDELRDDVNKLRGHWRSYPQEICNDATKALAEFISILEGEGARVRRPEPFLFSAPYETPYWGVKNGFCAANPRDVILVIGNTFIECPMAHRGRYWEIFPYRKLLREYFDRGAMWISGPRPELRDELYNSDYCYPKTVPDDLHGDWSKVNPDNIEFFTSESEPVFDAADFVRCGRDIYGQRSQVTNWAGIEWLRRYLEPTYRLHIIPNRSPSAYHIDTTFMPLAPNKVLINPNWLDKTKLPAALKRWDVFEAPKPRSTPLSLAGWMSDWISINILMIDEHRVIVEKEQEDLISAFKRWGFKPIPCSFNRYYPFLGSLHCATLDTFRRGVLEDYS